MRLSPGDYDRLQRTILALHEIRSAEDFDRALPGILLNLVRADCFFQMDYELGAKAAGAKPAGARLLRKIDPDRRITPQMIKFFEQAYFDHPFPLHSLRTGDLTPLKMSDFYNRHQLRNSGIYTNFYKALEAEDLISTVLIGLGQGEAGCISMGRRKDFSERDRLILTLLRPHLILARRNAERWSAWVRSRNGRRGCPALTPRESEIARWLAAGKTNFEIAAILESRVRTVEKHVERILAKLRVENRTAAAVMLAGRPA